MYTSHPGVASAAVVRVRGRFVANGGQLPHVLDNLFMWVTTRSPIHQFFRATQAHAAGGASSVCNLNPTAEQQKIDKPPLDGDCTARGASTRCGGSRKPLYALAPGQQLRPPSREGNVQGCVGEPEKVAVVHGGTLAACAREALDDEINAKHLVLDVICGVLVHVNVKIPTAV